MFTVYRAPFYLLVEYHFLLFQFQVQKPFTQRNVDLLVTNVFITDLCQVHKNKNN